MADGQADHEIVFRLVAEADPRSAKALKDFGKQVEEAQGRGGTKSGPRSNDSDRLKKQIRDEKLAAATRRQNELNEYRKTQNALAAIEDKTYQAWKSREDKKAKEERTRLASAQREAEGSAHRAERLRIAGGLRVTEAFESSAEAVMRLSRGFVMLGLAGEENTEKMLRGLIKVQAAFDLVVGGVKVIVRAQRMWQGLQTIALAQQTAEIALRKANAVAAKGEAVAIGQKAAASTAAAAAGAVEGAVGGGRRSTGTITGVGGRAVAGMVGRAALGAGRWIAGAALGLGKLVGVAVVLTEVIQGTRRAFGDTSKNAESFIGALMGWRKAAADAKKSTEDLAKAEQRRSNALGMIETRVKMVEADAEARAKRGEIGRGRTTRDIERAADMRGMTGSGRDLFIARGEQQRALGDVWNTQSRMDEAGRKVSEAANSGNMVTAGEARAELAKAQEDAVKASDRLAESAKERLRAEQEMAKVRIDAADKALKKSQEELDARKEGIKEEQNRLKSAEERFGAMTRGEQREMIRIQKKADEGGTLSVEEAKRLEGLGTRRTEAIASSTYRSRADAAGFGKYFGKEERAEIGKLQKEAKALEIQIRDQRQLKVTIERDDAALARALGEMVRREMEIRDRILEQMVAAELKKTKIEIAKESQIKESSRQGSM